MAMPFVPRDVFRLIVRLEGQKTHDVDTATLERRFRVPVGYGTDEAVAQRTRTALATTPGPGSYETDECWIDTRPRTTAVFASVAPRDPFQLVPLAREPPSRPLGASASVSSVLDVPPPLGSFARADRGMAVSTHRSTTAAVELPKPSSAFARTGNRFERAPRRTDGPRAATSTLGPAQYDVPRLWDVPHSHETPTSAVFGASTEKREVVWSPARTLPSHAVPDAWDASPAYAKHRRRVQQRLKQTKPSQTHASPCKDPVVMAHSILLRGKDSHNRRGDRPALDPFDWLRRQQHGEQRANALAAKHGLTDFVRPLTTTTVVTDTAEAAELGEDLRPVGLTHDDEDLTVEASAFHVHQPSYSSDPRLVVSCRLQGGLVLTIRIDATKSVRQLKAAIVRKQTRFHHEDQFDLYLVNGTLLSSPEMTLEHSGVGARALVQVVTR